MSKQDQAEALVSAINQLRAVRESLLKQELVGAADAVAESQHRLRAQLHILQEEGLGMIVGRLEAIV